MKRNLLAMCLLLLLVFVPAVEAAPSVSARCAILIDAESGLVLYEKNAHTRMYPASTTKVMTAILALENGNFDDVVTVSYNAVNTISFDSSKAGLYEGEEISFKDLVYTLLICSANDSANVIAEHIAGDVSSFVDMMNTRALEIGAKNTHFVNTHGLHNESHYTTAYDLAILASHAMKMPVFREIVAMRSYSLAPSNKFDETRYFNSTNHLLNPNSRYYYKNAVGIKTGYTDNAKSCLVSAAEANGKTYIAVVLGAENIDGQSMSFVDSRALLSYGVENYEPVELCKAGAFAKPIPIQNAKDTDAVSVHTSAGVFAILPDGTTPEETQMREYIKMDLKAPVSAGTVLGRREYWYGDIKVGETFLVADTDIAKENVFVRFFKTVFSSIWVYAVLLLVLCVFIFRHTKHIRVRRERRQRAEMRRRNKYQ